MLALLLLFWWWWVVVAHILQVFTAIEVNIVAGKHLVSNIARRCFSLQGNI